ncbi:MAG: hypothetical protein IJ161_10780, partial [Bacteroidales bacterium]|nr:hypothetical protein [Bacteroidales bacterium]
MIDLRNTRCARTLVSVRSITHFGTKVLSHEGRRRAAGPASRVTHFSMNDMQLPSFHRESIVGNSSLSEILRESIYKKVIFNQLRAVSENYPPMNEGFPPFSIFPLFFKWLLECQKKFLFLSNKNCFTFIDVFPEIKNNHIWSGRTDWSG